MAIELNTEDARGRGKVCALVPIKLKSERVEGKNFRDFSGKPLYSWLLNTLASCRSIDFILVDTDSDELMRKLAANYPKVIARRRRDELALPQTSMDEVLCDVVPIIDAEFVIQLHVTNPFLHAKTIDAAVMSYIDAERRGTTMSVSEIRGRLWSAELMPLNHEPSVMERTQDMDPVYKENSCFFIFRRSEFLESGVRMNQPVSVRPISDWEAIDIDTENDFIFASRLAGLI